MALADDEVTDGDGVADDVETDPDGKGDPETEDDPDGAWSAGAVVLGSVVEEPLGSPLGSTAEPEMLADGDSD